MTSDITSIVDALIANFDKLIMDLVKHKYGYLFCQSLIDVVYYFTKLKFKDVRLRRILKRLDSNLPELVADENASLVILVYANQLPAADMKEFVEFCKSEYKMCLQSGKACKIFAKVLSKVTDVEKLEIELHLKKIMPQVFDRNEGKELVEVFLSKADPQNLQPLLKQVFDKLTFYIRSEEFDYFFAKLAELKRTDIIDSIIQKIFFDSKINDKE